MTQGYCLKCKKQREIKNGKKVTLKNGQIVIKGPCSVCGTTITRFTKS